MKRAAAIISIVTILIAVMSCSNKFLEENEVDLFTLSDTVFVNSYDGNVQVSLQTPLDDEYDFTIYMQPRWLSFNSMHGKILNGNFTLDLTVLHEEAPLNYPVTYSTVLLDVEGFGILSLTVAYQNYSNAEMQHSPSSFTFYSVSPQQLTIANTGVGLMVWEITSKPDWLTVSFTKDTLYPNESSEVEIWIKTEMMTPGEMLTGNIAILSNARFSHTLIPVTVNMSSIPPSDPGQATSILTDAEYHHDSGIMAICTKSPNQLFLINKVTGVWDTIPLDKTPMCISFTEDGHKAVLGYSVASVAYIDVDNSEIIAEYNIDCIPYDIVPGENGWCYITPVSDQWVKLRNLNLTTGEVSTTATMIYEKTIIKKVPGKPYMAGSQLGLSPSDLLIFDVTDGKAKDAITNYFESIGHFWLSKDGVRLYSEYGNVYTLPEYDGLHHTSAPPVYGNIDSESSYIKALDDCPVINSVFVNSSTYYYQGGNSSVIEQFNATSLNKVKTFNVSPEWLNLTGSNYLYETTPSFIFVNKEGTAMYVLKSLREDYDSDWWFMETIEL